MVIVRKVNWNRNEQIIEPEETSALVSSPEVMIPVSSNQTATVAQVRVNRNGNGHVARKVRSINDQERARLWQAFTIKNGQVNDKDCSDWKSNGLVAVEITIWQVTGHVSYLHREIAEGKKVVPDMIAYGNWMREKYGHLWGQYTNPLFGEVRATNERARAQGEQATSYVPFSQVPILPFNNNRPQFKAFAKRGYYKG